MPMLTTRNLLELLNLDPRRGMTKGALEWHRRTLNQHGGGAGVIPQRRLIEALKAVPTSTHTKYTSPFDHAVAVFERAPFSASDVAWLQRLPLDPTAITDDDIKELQRLHAQAEPRSGDARLVKAILNPVEALHNRRRAEANLAALKESAPVDPPTEFFSALAAAVKAEVPELDEDEALARASKLLREAVAERAQTYDRALAQAQAELQPAPA